MADCGGARTVYRSVREAVKKAALNGVVKENFIIDLRDDALSEDFRERTGIDVDVVIELRDGSVIAFEINASSTIKQEHFRGLRFLRDRLGALPIAALWEV